MSEQYQQGRGQRRPRTERHHRQRHRQHREAHRMWHACQDTCSAHHGAHDDRGSQRPVHGSPHGVGDPSGQALAGMAGSDQGAVRQSGATAKPQE
jgi:hypothetical protein